MQNIQDTSEARKWLFMSASTICMTVPLNNPPVSMVHYLNSDHSTEIWIIILNESEACFTFI